MKDIRNILEEYNIPYKENTNGWINICCPYCQDSKFHLGYNAEFSVFSCYRCGRHSFVQTLSLLTNKDIFETKEIIKNVRIKSTEYNNVERVEKSELIYPDEVTPLMRKHIAYLTSRGFNAGSLQSLWGIMGTKHEGKFADRIIIPIVFKKRPVSFMARDITGKSSAKMLFCNTENEIMPAKHLLHGYDMAIQNWVLVTEGPFDAFRFGPGAVDTMGIKFTESQVSLLKGFANVFILFDSRIDHNGFETEKQAQAQAEKLADLLSPFCNVWILNEFRSDLGDMDNLQVLKIKQEIKNALIEQRRKENV